MTRRLALLLVATALVRLVPILVADRVTADVLRYQKVATHVLDVSWNPYEAPRLYPYPPVWVVVEVLALWLSRHLDWSFAVLVKLPVLLADLGLVALLARMGASRGLGMRAAWLFALHPVSILVTGFHGQFDAAALLCLLLAVFWLEARRFDLSALALAGGIALKSFPVLLLPFFLLSLAGIRARLRYAALATLPVAALLLPFAIDNASALRRELLGYGGVADFGWIGLVRGVRWLLTGVLARSEAAHWPTLVPLAKAAFLAAFALLLALVAARRLRLSLDAVALAVFLAFLTFYGALSAQYLIWVVPFGLLVPDRYAVLHALASTLALLGFYPFLAPGVLFEATGPTPGAGVVWALGTGALLAASAVWFGVSVARGRQAALLS
jgi:Gpi18-like mannosyltransferase